MKLTGFWRNELCGVGSVEIGYQKTPWPSVENSVALRVTACSAMIDLTGCPISKCKNGLREKHFQPSPTPTASKPKPPAPSSTTRNAILASSNRGLDPRATLHTFSRARVTKPGLPAAETPIVQRTGPRNARSYNATRPKTPNRTTAGAQKRPVVQLPEPKSAPSYNRPAPRRDPDDQMVLEAAVNGRADALGKHVRTAAARFGLRLVRPVETLREIIEP